MGDNANSYIIWWRSPTSPLATPEIILPGTLMHRHSDQHRWIQYCRYADGWKLNSNTSSYICELRLSPDVQNAGMYPNASLTAWWRHQMETFSALLALCAGNSPHKGQWRGALMFSLICARIDSWVNNGEAGDLKHHRAHYDVIVMDYHWTR